MILEVKCWLYIVSEHLSPIFFFFTPSSLQGSSFSHLYPSWLSGDQPSGCKPGHYLWCLLEPVLWHSEHFQGVPFRPTENGVRLQVFGSGEERNTKGFFRLFVKCELWTGTFLSSTTLMWCTWLPSGATTQSIWRSLVRMPVVPQPSMLGSHGNKIACVMWVEGIHI